MSIWNASSRLGRFDREDDTPVGDDVDSLPMDWTSYLRPARVLLVSEDEGLRRSLAGQLRHDRYVVDEAIGACEAIALLARAEGHAYDLVVSALDLHILTGLELLDELRSSPLAEHRAVPAILLGDHPSSLQTAEAERLHAVLFDTSRGHGQLWLEAHALVSPVQLDVRAG